ncbi:hypothetical protein CQA40_07105 [Helicobacter sp. MIT 01-3238]|nr:hypothetical protein CQA40_07105 [Helicobacter sp. MIT 01-3238]
MCFPRFVLFVARKLLIPSFVPSLFCSLCSLFVSPFGEYYILISLFKYLRYNSAKTKGVQK